MLYTREGASLVWLSIICTRFFHVTRLCFCPCRLESRKTRVMVGRVRRCVMQKASIWFVSVRLSEHCTGTHGCVEVDYMLETLRL